MPDEIHKGDIGTRFLITIIDNNLPSPLETATTKEIIFKKPNNDIITKTAIFYTDGTDAKIYYDSIADDLDEIGDWRLQVSLIFPDGAWKSDVEVFVVHSNLE